MLNRAERIAAAELHAPTVVTADTRGVIHRHAHSAGVGQAISGAVGQQRGFTVAVICIDDAGQRRSSSNKLRCAYQIIRRHQANIRLAVVAARECAAGKECCLKAGLLSCAGAENVPDAGGKNLMVGN